MYSVLIQNQKTIESFQEFHPLYMEAINSGQLGVCRWLESGTTIDTALPELTKMVEDKEEWRAIIVRVFDEEDMSQYEYSSQNPYDFQYYHEEGHTYHESPIPLVRVTNILGGMPTPEIKYEAITIQEENKSPKIVYRPKKSDDENKIYQALNEKYDYDGKSPSEIILVTIRLAKKEKRENIERVWTNHKEIESSAFWKKNAYSPQCRFIVYDMKKQGSVQYTADMFKFWTGVLMLVQNQIDTDELQAYRLYKMDLGIDKNILENSIQKTLDCMQGARYYMQQLLRRENNRHFNQERKLPDYKLEVPVVFDVPRSGEMNVDASGISLISKSLSGDLKQWNSSKRDAEHKLKKVVAKAEIALDESAERMRGLRTVEESDVLKLDKYQSRMMDADLQNIYSMMQDLQQELPDNSVTDGNIQNKAEDVKQSILDRITSGQIVGIILIMLGLMALTILPGLIVYTLSNIGKKESIVSFVLLLADIFVIPIAIMILQQNRDVKEKISKYNHALNSAVRKVGENAGVYSEFLSSIVSHSRGKSYLHILQNKKFSVSSKHRTIERHMRAVDAMIDTLDTWSRAFYLDINFNSGYCEDNEFDIRVRPAQNRLYTLEYGKEYQVPLNRSGQKVYTNYEFVTKMELTREELYD